MRTSIDKSRLGNQQKELHFESITPGVVKARRHDFSFKMHGINVNYDLFTDARMAGFQHGQGDRIPECRADATRGNVPFGFAADRLDNVRADRYELLLGQWFQAYQLQPVCPGIVGARQGALANEICSLFGDGYGPADIQGSSGDIGIHAHFRESFFGLQHVQRFHAEQCDIEWCTGFEQLLPGGKRVVGWYVQLE